MAVGNIHGAISAATRGQKKVEARLNIEHLDKINKAVSAPLVLHGGTGIRKEYILESIRHGIAKINIATTIRQPYEALCKESISKAQEAVFKATVGILIDELEMCCVL